LIPANHPKVEQGRIGVLLVNLGTPDAPEAKAVRRYLAEFLSDPRVIEIPKLAWLPILHGIILRTRPKKSAHAYKQVWTEAGSPLAAITRQQAEALQPIVERGIIVDFAMRYGNPGIRASINNMVALGCDRILVAPL
jgi:protoporphyrin/coproporphyrin ferrochelatase